MPNRCWASTNPQSSVIGRVLDPPDTLVEPRIRSTFAGTRIARLWVGTCSLVEAIVVDNPSNRNPRANGGNLCVASLMLLGTFAQGEAFGQRIVYVNTAATGSADGTSWADAYVDLRDALEDTRAIGGCPCEIWVAEGLYKPDRGTGDRTMHFAMQSGVGLYGGFGGWEHCRDERDATLYRTVLGGDLLGNDDPDFVPTSSCCIIGSGELGCDDTTCQSAVQQHDYRHCASPNWIAADCVPLAGEFCCNLCRTPRCDNSYNVLRADIVDATAVLDGFEVRGSEANGYPDYPYLGGLSAYRSQLVIENCVFADNTPLAIDAYYEDLGPTITHSVFEHNLGYSDESVAVYTRGNFDGMATITDNVFRYNRGAGLLTDTTTPIRNSLFLENTSTGLIGRNLNYPLIVEDCLFLRNGGGGMYPRNGGGGMYADFAVVRRSMFLGNSALAGGAIWASLGASLRDSIVVGNWAWRGSAVFGDLGTALIVNSTIAGNQDFSWGGAVDGTSVVIRNSILWGNAAEGVIDESSQFYYDHYYGSLSIDRSIIDGWSGAFGGVGNSGSDPLFVDSDGPDGIFGTGDDDLRLSPDSPAINAGNPNYVPYTGETDLDGHARILCGRVDLGAYEFGIGDYACDRIVDLTDFAAWPGCMTGPITVPLTPQTPSPCAAFDFDADGAIDLLDLGAWVNLLTRS